MEIIKREEGTMLLKQYGRNYIRFMAGGISDILYQLPITETEFELIISNKTTCDSVVNYYMNNESNLSEKLIDGMLMDYLNFTTKYSEIRKKAIISKLHRHGDIFFEFYYFILRERFKESGGHSVLGFTAEKLHKDYQLSVLGAYNYLIYLREEPKEALEDLKKGLPRK